MQNDDFEIMLDKHLSLVKKQLLLCSKEMQKRALEHDQDKLNDININQTYKKYFPELKKIPFGTEEYFEFEKIHFLEAHKKHAQNRHHYYSSKSKVKDVNLFDILEAIIDISQSSKQYNNSCSVEESLRKKNIFDYELEEIICNTINYLEEKTEKS